MLTVNYFILAEKAVATPCGATDWRLTLVPLAAVVAIIPLTASLALKFKRSTRTALIAASLTAFNPPGHVGSGHSRPFALSGVQSIGNR